MPNDSNAPSSRLLDAVKAAVDVLDKERIPYALAGGIALAFWTEPRATYDVDLVAAVAPHELDRIVQAFQRDGRFPIEPTIIPLPPELSIVRAHLPAQGESGSELILLDCLVVEGDFAASIMARRVEAELAGMRLWFCSREDLVILKLVAGRRKDQEDIRAVLRNHGDSIDRACIEAWADRFHCRPLWIELQATTDE